MNQVAATQLIAQTFDSAFEEQTFETFMANLLNQVDRGKSFGYRSGNIIPQAFREHISTYRRPFVYYDPNGERLDVLIVRLSKISGLERARTMQRNFAAWYLKQEHDEVPEAALIAFYNLGVNDWRFSFVRLEYAFGVDGAEEKLTPARRYSFLVGSTEPTHTAESQLHPFLIEDATNPIIADLAAAFQIETVSKQFFEEYKELFLKLVEGIQTALKEDKLLAADFKRSEIHVSNFAKKLLGQIVFLYFVQKKGWLGVAPGEQWGSGRRDFLRRLFTKEEGVTYSNFFNDVLESLFYEALAVKREEDSFAIGGFTCQMPFLNGGLFEPMGGYDWQHTRLLLPNTLFSNRKNKDDDSGTGVLDVFDRYNFTVWEEEPLEKEVAVDPEMLGKVFENLLEVQDRKSKGAFYTPRQIVHYMCQEILINYLDTSLNLVERGLAEEKPAQTDIFGGSKPQQKAMKTMTSVERVPREDIAVLVQQGALALQQDAAKEAGLKSGDYVLPQTVRDHAHELDKMLATIKLCDPAIGSGAFPVGMLHEIVQARQALATYLGEPNRHPYPLKWHAIQETIFGVDIDAGAVEIAKLRLWLSLVVDEESFDNIHPLPNLDYKIVCGNSLLGVEKTLFNNHLFVKMDELKQQYFEETHRQEKLKLKAQIDQLIELLSGAASIFDYEVYFHEVFAENGGFDMIIGNPPYNELRDLSTNEQLAYKTSQFYKHAASGRVNLFQFFYPLSLNLVKDLGQVSLITQNSILAEESTLANRRFIVNNSKILKFVSFPERDNPRTRVFEKAKMSVCIGFLQSAKTTPSDYELEIKVWYDRYFCNGHTLNLRLSEIKDIFPRSLIFPIATSEAFRILKKVKLKKDTFYIKSMSGEIDMTKYKKRFNLTGEGYRVLTGAQVLRYRITDTPSQGDIIYLDINLSNLPKSRHVHINNKRIVMQRITGVDSKVRLIMTIIPENVLCANSTNYIFNNDTWNLKSLLGLLNSKLINYYFKQTSTNTNITTTEINNIPIPKSHDIDFINRISELVNAILTFNQNINDSVSSEKQSRIQSLELRIDRLVYQLYGLTKDEIILIEETI